MTKRSGPNSTPPLNGVDGIPETTVNRQSYVVLQIDLFENENLRIFLFFFIFFEYTWRVISQEKKIEAWMEMFNEIQKLQFWRWKDFLRVPKLALIGRSQPNPPSSRVCGAKNANRG